MEISASSFSALQSPCQCGHAATLHDAHGCAAFLAAFTETAGIRAHCRCQRPRSETAEIEAATDPSWPSGSRIAVAPRGVAERPPDFLGLRLVAGVGAVGR